MGDIAAVLLAAGASRRFGADKLLHPVDASGTTLLARSLQSWLKVFERVTVVIRPESGVGYRRQIEQSLDPEQSAAVHWIMCPDAMRGMASSLACGIMANRDAGGWLIGLADMPDVPHAVISAVREAIAAGAPLAAPFCDGRRGHPVGFAAGYRDELLALHGDAGARHLLQRDAGRMRAIATADHGIFTDIDSPEDLQQLQHPP